MVARRRVEAAGLWAASFAVELAGGLPVAVEFEAAGLLEAGDVGDGLAAEIGGGGEVPGGGGPVEQEAGGDAFQERAMGGDGAAPRGCGA